MVLKITQEQMDILSNDRLRRFADDLKKYAVEEFPKVTAELTDEKLDKLIDYTLKTTKAYGFTDKSHICKYMNIMFIHGTQFADKCAWASAILSDSTLNSGDLRIHRLYEAAIENA